ncbi:pyridoxamine 5'-phosphate oxidase family protein [Streptomyces sp. AC555_RSS877]|uniref:pyridoxamine 5'-phosphate oxidase family protein n=1 Tax=Streptomyces sp. AC555_RSS877 TaxID=2823688 RepID=UPI001C275412|nr:pyridoxamine 5'-phosphate oxidase family protein [Streptomyces sp. AC555_RSS877]
MTDPAPPLVADVLDRLEGQAGTRTSVPGKNVWLCAVRPDGSPHVTPVWFVFLRDGR